MNGISDLEVFKVLGGYRLFSSAFADGGLQSFRLAAGQAASYADVLDAGPTSGTYGVTNISIFTARGQDILLPSGRYDDKAAVHNLNSDGGFSLVKNQSASANVLGQFTEVEHATFGARTYIYASQAGRSGFETFNLTAKQDMHFQRLTADTDLTKIGDIADMEVMKVGRRTFLFAASTLDAGVSSFRIKSHGQTTHVDTVNPSDGGGFSLPTVLETTKSGGHSFLLMGAAGTDSISVFRVSNRGTLTETGYQQDDLSTRFAGVAAMTSFTISDRSFVIAGGSDDGLTLFELNPNGTLFTLGSVADQLDTTLNNVTAISAQVFGSEVQVFAAGEGDAGITQFSIDMSSLGVVQKGKRTPDHLIGTPQDDLLFGMRGKDTLDGGAGDDRISDGYGRDTMTGGPGADVFVFTQDGKTDVVTDFVMGEDRLDLSDFSMLYHFSDIEIQTRSYGFRLVVQGEVIALHTAPGPTALGHELGQDDFIF